MQPKDFKKINLSLSHNSAVVTLGADGKFALDLTFWEELDSLITFLEDHGSPPLVIIGGKTCFCEGVDLQWLLLLAKRKARIGQLHEALYEVSCFITETAFRLRTYSNLSISVANGACIGMGAELFLMSDVRIVAENFSFSLPELSLSMIPDVCGLERLYNILGNDLVLSLLVSGRQVKAEESVSTNLAAFILHSYTAAIAASEELLSHHLNANKSSVFKHIKKQQNINVVPEEIKSAKDAIRFNITNFDLEDFISKVDQRLSK